MARAYPFVDALEDSSLGLSGGHLNMPFIVEIDNVGDDPYGVLMAVAPQGSDLRTVPGMPVAIARRFVGLVVVEHTTMRLLNERTYRAIVVYGPASDRTIGLWRRSVRFASETKPFTWSLPEIDEKGNYTPVGKPKKVGSHTYEPVAATFANLTPYSAKIRKGTDVLPTYQPLVRTGFFEDSNLSVNDGLTSIVYEILAPQLTTDVVRGLGSLKWHTNKYEWNGYPNWTLIFANWEAHDEVIVLPGSRPTVSWYSNVVMEILYRPKDQDTSPFGWRAITLPEFYKKDSNPSVPVFKLVTGGTVMQATETYVQYEQVDFDTLFGLIGYGSPVV